MRHLIVAAMLIPFVCPGQQGRPQAKAAAPAQSSTHLAQAQARPSWLAERLQDIDWFAEMATRHNESAEVRLHCGEVAFVLSDFLVRESDGSDEVRRALEATFASHKVCIRGGQFSCPPGAHPLGSAATITAEQRRAWSRAAADFADRSLASRDWPQARLGLYVASSHLYQVLKRAPNDDDANLGIGTSILLVAASDNQLGNLESARHYARLSSTFLTAALRSSDLATKQVAQEKSERLSVLLGQLGTAEQARTVVRPEVQTGQAFHTYQTENLRRAFVWAAMPSGSAPRALLSLQDPVDGRPFDELDRELNAYQIGLPSDPRMQAISDNALRFFIPVEVQAFVLQVKQFGEQKSCSGITDEAWPSKQVDDLWGRFAPEFKREFAKTTDGMAAMRSLAKILECKGYRDVAALYRP